MPGFVENNVYRGQQSSRVITTAACAPSATSAR
jgi:hypothetical protein